MAKVKEYISGNEAVAKAALNCGVTVITGYPGTPSSETIGSIWSKKDKEKTNGVEIQWSSNEKVALEIAGAAAWAGKASLCTMKMSGINVAYDSLISLVYSGCTGAMVLYVCDDPGVSAGMPEQDVRGFAKMSDMPVLEPSSVQESYDMTRYAFELSHKIGMPVMLRSVTNVALSHSIAEIDDEKNIIEGFDLPAYFIRDITKYTKAGAKICMDQHRDLIDRCEKARQIIHEDGINKVRFGKKDGFGIIAVGVCSTYIPEAVALVNKEKLSDITVAEVKMSFPAPTDELSEILKYCSNILVVEENEPYIEDALKLLNSEKAKCKIHGKHSGAFSRIGAFNARIVAKGIASALDIRLELPEMLENPVKDCAVRPIGVCVGCPHRGVYVGINRAIRLLGFKKDDFVVTGDIGCTILGMSPPFNTLWTEVSMGAAIAMAQGFVYAGIKTPLIATVGDSTFLHAGMPALINAVQNQCDITVVIMDNGWTAMTGMQVNAGTNKDFQQSETKSTVDLAKLVPAMGVTTCTVVDSYDVGKVAEAIVASVKNGGVNVILARRECAIQAGRRKIKYGVYKVDDDKCTRCKSCILTCGCPGLVFADNKILIDNAQCNGCGVCSQVCPVKAITLI